jgi:hypothetical protein
MDERPISMTTFERLCLAATMVIIGFAFWFRFASHDAAAKPAIPDLHQLAPMVISLLAVITDIALFVPYLLALLINRHRNRIAVWLLYAWELLLIAGCVIEARESGIASAEFAQPFIAALLIGLALIALNSPDSRKWRARHAGVGARRASV